ncbi:MAG: hypothetical protein SPK09_00670 [Porphyromonas sp.]|nr:hypothetical protein [Porphyromonas sp.]
MRYTRQITATLMATLLLAYACGKDEPQRQSEPEQPKQEQPAKEEPKPKTEEDKPKDPPAETPPAEGDKPKDPPAETPPAEGDKPKDPPAETPPAEGDKPKDPPAETPPAEGDKPKDPPADTKHLPRRKLLLVDFTGQRCHNCLVALKGLEAEQQELGDKRVLISMHPFSYYSPELQTQRAREYASFGNVSGVPNLRFNNATGNLPFGRWREILEEPDIIDQSVEHRLEGESVRLSIKAKLRPELAEQWRTRQFNILVWVVEDDVLATQVDSNNNVVAGYRHQHLFRGILGENLWGDNFSFDSGFSMLQRLPTLNDKRKAKLVVLFVDRDTKEALDVSEYALQ